MHPDPSAQTPSVEEMTLVDIATELESLTRSIEAERAKERRARAEYEQVASEVNEACGQLRERARLLMAEQRKRMSGFDGLVNRDRRTAQIEAKPLQRMTMPAAILAIWDVDGYDRPLTTDEIADGLEIVGYETHAAPRSLKSSINQTIAKLCNAHKLAKYRSDGTPLEDVDGARARRYLRADLAEARAK